MVTIAYSAKNRAQYCRVEPDESEHHITFTILLSSDKSSMRTHNCTTAANPILQEAEDSTEYVHSKKLVLSISTVGEICGLKQAETKPGIYLCVHGEVIHGDAN